MAEFIVFDEGMRYVATNGLPSTCYFLLSRLACNDLVNFTVRPGGGRGYHLATDTLASGLIDEITGTGYTRKSQSRPTPTDGDPPTIQFSECQWSTGTAGDWPTGVRSIVLVTSADNSGKAIMGWEP